MRELIKPVLLTYATRRSMQWAIGLGGTFYALVIFALAMHRHSRNNFQAGEGGFSVGLVAIFISYLLVSQAKWQFVDPRARLLPQFARPHLVVLLAFAVVGLFFMPLLTAIAARLSVVGYLACTIALASSFIWAMHANSGGGTLISMTLFFSMMSERVRNFWLLPASVEQLFPLHLAVFLAGWTALAAWLVRLSRMTEESDDYNIPIQAQSGSSTRMERTQASRTLMRNKLGNGLWNGGPSDWWHDRLINHRARSIRERQGLFRYGFAPLPFEFSVGWMTLIMATMALLFRWLAPSDGLARSFSVGALAPLVFLPAMMPGQFLAMRRARMAQELLLPLSRQRFIDGVLLELARVMVISLVVLGTAALMLIWLIPYDFPSTPRILAGLAVVLSLQPCFFGVNVYAALWNSAAARTGIMMLALFPVMMVCMGALTLLVIRKDSNPVWSLAIAATMLPIGLWAVAKARRKWLDAELAT